MFNTSSRRHRRRRKRQEAEGGANHNSLGIKKRRRRKLPGWVIAPILAGVFLVCFGVSKVFGGNTNVMQLKVVEAQREDVKEVFHTSGIVVSEKSKTFYSPVNAPVKRNKAKLGEAVKKGDALVTFDTTNLDRDNQTSKLNTLSAQYTSQDMKEQSGRAKETMEKAKKQEEAAITELKSQINKKEAEIKKLEKQAKKQAAESNKSVSESADIQKKMTANLDDQSTYKAKKENAERQLANISDHTDEQAEEAEQTKAQLVKEAEEATNEISRLESEYRTLEQQLKQTGADSSGGNESQAGGSAAVQSLSQAKQELDSLKASLSQAENSRQISADSSPTDAQLKNMQVSENLAQLAELTTTELLQKGKEGIKAEFDGVISDVKVLEGSDAVQGGELFTLVSNRDVSVELEVSAGDFDKLVTGEKAVIVIGQNLYQGTLETVNKIALPNEKGNPVIGAKIHIDDPDDEIYIGVTAKVNMTVAEKEDALCLPNEIINTASDGDFVYVIKDGIVKKQRVEVGVTSTSMSEIISGISEGDEVVSEISDNIKEGVKAAGVKEDSGETDKR